MNEETTIVAIGNRKLAHDACDNIATSLRLEVPDGLPRYIVVATPETTLRHRLCSSIMSDAARRAGNAANERVTEIWRPGRTPLIAESKKEPLPLEEYKGPEVGELLDEPDMIYIGDGNEEVHEAWNHVMNRRNSTLLCALPTTDHGTTMQWMQHKGLTEIGPHMTGVTLSAVRARQTCRECAAPWGSAEANKRADAQIRKAVPAKFTAEEQAFVRVATAAPDCETCRGEHGDTVVSSTLRWQWETIELLRRDGVEKFAALLENAPGAPGPGCAKAVPAAPDGTTRVRRGTPTARKRDRIHRAPRTQTRKMTDENQHTKGRLRISQEPIAIVTVGVALAGLNLITTDELRVLGLRRLATGQRRERDALLRRMVPEHFACADTDEVEQRADHTAGTDRTAQPPTKLRGVVEHECNDEQRNRAAGHATRHGSRQR